MPTYEYVCKDCGFEFEEFQSIKADPLTNCPKCNGNIIRKIGSGAGLLFKGSGFYITDYKNKSSASNETGSKESKDSPNKTTSQSQKTKTETKKAS